jgi:hypothetical protein
VNNDGTFYPHASASFSSRNTSPATAQDGNYWYHLAPANRWTTEGSTNDREWFAVDFGTQREIHRAALYFLEDDPALRPPSDVELQYHDGRDWKSVPDVRRDPERPAGRRANHFRFSPLATQKLRALLGRREGAALGLTEFEAWGGPGDASLDPPPLPPSLATNVAGDGFPRASASHTSRFDQVDRVNDGIINYRPSPANRWTAYQSPDEADWLEIDFGRPQTIGRMDLHIYDDGGGVQAPADFMVQIERDGRWMEVENIVRQPEKPQGGTVNRVTFDPVQTRRVRVVFTHAEPARSGLTEIHVWEK